ncbi:hypothetical protein EWM64_g2769 [Hericium alpestre]|uniref:Uncharacterized protein n=1 Tax=Hericium alpestre TaxID=135208 RepID=A0A4Z0A2J4_9AGAM|nr:hypothetical protein EWM64_g2769 [Hericium alpestre]
MPSITLSDELILLHPEDIICSVNIQHDCHKGGCKATQKEYRMQERLITAQSRLLVQHSDNIHFIVNMHALHNHKQIRKALPSHLVKSSFSIADVASLRRDAAASIRSKKAEQTEAKKRTLVAKISHRAKAPNPLKGASAPNNDAEPHDDSEIMSVHEQVINSLEDDEQLIDVLASAFTDQDFESHEAGTILDGHQDSSSTVLHVQPPRASENLGVQDQSVEKQALQALRSATVAVLKYLCRQEKVKQSGVAQFIYCYAPAKSNSDQL